MRFALNRRAIHGRIILTAEHINLAQLLDKAEHGDTLHKIVEPPATGKELIQLVDAQLSNSQYTTV